MQTPADPSTTVDLRDVEREAQPGHGWTTTLRRTLRPVLGARENALEALLECQARAAQRREVAEGLIPGPRRPAE
jgi:hypothetical protein